LILIGRSLIRRSPIRAKSVISTWLERARANHKTKQLRVCVKSEMIKHYHSGY